MLSNQFKLFILAFAAFTGAYGLVSRKIDRAPRDDAQFWLQKLEAAPNATVVLGGDSRVNRGLSPEVFSNTFGGVRVENFAFSGGGYSKEYLQAVEKLVANKGLVILGVSPRSLTKLATKTSGFATWSQTTAVERANLNVLHKLDLFFTPENPVLLVGRVVGHGPTYGQEYHPHGWLPGSRIPEDPKASLVEYENMFKKEKVAEDTVQDLVEFIGRAKAKGVTVIAFRPPTTSEIVNLENSKSGYDEAKIKSTLTSAAALWIDVPQTKYPTFDGNHLTKSGAIEFSTEFADIIKGQGLAPK